MKTTLLIENLDLSEAIIDAEARTVRQTIIRAGMSKNGRFYSPLVLEKARPLFEGIRTYANHPSSSDMKDRPERSVLDITGYITDVIFENDSIKGTRHFVGEAGERVWKIVEHVVNNKAPNLIGASINAVGRGRKDKHEGQDTLIVESIDHVNSVDDVTTPAAGGAFERLIASSDELLTTILNTMSFEEWFESRPEFVKRLQGEMKVVRQDGALKAAQADAQGAKTALQEAQNKADKLLRERDAALLDVEKARRELAVVEALAKVALPTAVKSDLRTQLQDASPEKWETIIESELKKAKAYGGLPRVNVTGAGQRTDKPITPLRETKPRVDWSKVRTPQEQQRLLEAIQKGEILA